MRSVEFRLFAIVAVVTMALIGAQAALAKPKPGVTWTSSRSASVGNPISVSWTSKHLPKGARLVVQKPVGTAHVFKTVIKLDGPNGTAQLPAQKSLGKYKYRLAALEGKTVIAKQAVTIGVFGEVPFTTLFDNADPGIHATPTTSFSYIAQYEGDLSPAFTVAHNHCSSVHIGFVGSAEDGLPGTATLTLVQESREPVAVSAGFESVGSLDAILVPGRSWAVNVRSEITPGTEDYGVTYTQLNGYAICDSAEPF